MDQKTQVRTRGFSMVEILVALAIMTVLTAVLVPAFTSKLKDSRSSAISQTMNGLSSGMAEYKKALGRYPGTMVLLSTNPTTSVTDLCGTALTSSAIVLWRGPYISREFVATGIPMGDALILNPVRRFPTTVTSSPPTVAYALMDLTGVEDAVAADLDLLLDGVSGMSAGTIRYTKASIAAQNSAGMNQTPAIPTAPASTVNLTYAIPINPTSC